jgi:hypothetical protein
MSVPVDLEGLSERIAEFGPAAFLVTVGDNGPHVVSVVIEQSTDGALVAAAGRRTRANIAARPVVTLLWPAAPGGSYSLLVDGTATVAGDEGPTAVAPTKAVLHRVADATGSGPTCLPVSEPAPVPAPTATGG